MLIYIGADHRGYNLKEILKKYITEKGYEIVDLGNNKYDESDNYVDFAVNVANKVSKDPTLCNGLLICGSGIGADIVANKFKNVRCSLCSSPDQAVAAKEHDDANILALGSDFLDENLAKKIVSSWLVSRFDQNPNHALRLKKIGELEQKITNYLE